MKKIILLLLLCKSVSAWSQDVITKRNGDELLTKVIEILDIDVKFKKWSNQDGPTYTMKKSEIFMIKYQNGEKDVFQETLVQTNDETNAPKQPHGIIATPDSENAKLVEYYNNMEHEFGGIKVKKSKGKYFLGTIGVATQSVLSTDEIQVIFVQDKENYYYTKDYCDWRYHIELRNKTSNLIYVDKLNCSQTTNNGKTTSYYNDEQMSVSNGKNGGANVNLGSVAGALGVGGALGTLASGVNVGGGRSSSVTSYYADNRFVQIAPNGQSALMHTIINEEGKKEVAESIEGPNPLPSTGEKIVYNENNTPSKTRFVILYSSDPEFNTYKTLTFEVYLKEAIGLPKLHFVDRPYQPILTGKPVIMVGANYNR